VHVELTEVQALLSRRAARQIRREASWIALLPIGSVMLLALGLRCFHLDYLSLWNDEIFSHFYYDTFGLRFLWTTGLTQEPTPPLYYTLLELWMRLFGGSASAMRALSVAASVCSVPLVYAIGRSLWAEREGLVAALLFTACPFAVYFAQEARVYALTALPTGLALWAMITLSRQPRRLRPLVLYTVCAALCLWCHATLLFFVAACNAGMAVLLLGLARRDRITLIFRWLVANLIALMMAAPAIYGMLVVGRHGTGLAWMPPFSLRDIVVSGAALASGVVTPAYFPGWVLSLILLGTLAVSLVRHPPGLRAFAIVLVVPATFFVLLVMASLIRPVLLPRVLYWLAVPLCLLLARQAFGRARVGVPILLATILTFGVGLTYQLAFADGAKEPWREVMRTLEPELRQADLVVLSPRTSPFIVREYAPYIAALARLDEPLPPDVQSAGVARKLAIPSMSEGALLERIRAGRPVWMLSNYVDRPFVQHLLAEAPPPASQFRWRCLRVTCVVAIHWGN
jgi:mannosyltransferase